MCTSDASCAWILEPLPRPRRERRERPTRNTNVNITPVNVTVVNQGGCGHAHTTASAGPAGPSPIRQAPTVDSGGVGPAALVALGVAVLAAITVPAVAMFVSGVLAIVQTAVYVGAAVVGGGAVLLVARDLVPELVDTACSHRETMARIRAERAAALPPTPASPVQVSAQSPRRALADPNRTERLQATATVVGTPKRLPNRPQP